MIDSVNGILAIIDDFQTGHFWTSEILQREIYLYFDSPSRGKISTVGLRCEMNA